MKHDTDSQLLGLYAQGNARAFDFLVQRYTKSLYAWLRSQLGNDADAGDLFQETWIRVARHADRFSDVSFKAWLWRIARNQTIDFYRRRRLETVSLDANMGEDGATFLDAMPSLEAMPVSYCDASEQEVRIRELVDALPAVQREIFLLRTQSSLSFQEIATMLSIPLNTALGRMHDALQKLKKSLKEEEIL